MPFLFYGAFLLPATFKGPLRHLQWVAMGLALLCQSLHAGGAEVPVPWKWFGEALLALGAALALAAIIRWGREELRPGETGERRPAPGSHASILVHPREPLAETVPFA